MDLGTGLTILGTAKLAEKLLGPTAAYLGSGLKDYTQKAVQNLNNIFSSAIKKVTNIDDGCQVAPRILKNILSEGSFCEDRLTAEYFGGVLASSRTPTGRDDRGATWAALLGRLSTYEIRTHYLIYRAIRVVFQQMDYKFNIEDRSKLQIFIPHSSYLKIMEFSVLELKRIGQILDHTFFGLAKEDIIENFLFGSAEGVKKHYPEFVNIEESGIVITPSKFGVLFYLWAHGLGQVDSEDFLKTNFLQLDNAPKPLIAFSQEMLKKKPEKGGFTAR